MKIFQFIIFTFVSLVVAATASYADGQTCTVRLGPGELGAWKYTATLHDRIVPIGRTPVYVPDTTEAYCKLYSYQCVDPYGKPSTLYDLNVQDHSLTLKRYGCDGTWKREDDTHFTCIPRVETSSPAPVSDAEWNQIQASTVQYSEPQGLAQTEKFCHQQMGRDLATFQQIHMPLWRWVDVKNPAYTCKAQGPNQSVLICTMMFPPHTPNVQDFDGYVCDNYHGEWVTSMQPPSARYTCQPIAGNK